MRHVLHCSAIRTGIGYLAVTVTSITSATISSRGLARVGAERRLPTGLVMACIGLVLPLRISPTSGYVDILPSLILIGGGNGASFVSMTSLAVGGVPGEDTGIASALLNASQQIGGSLGIALLTAVAAARFSAIRPENPLLTRWRRLPSNQWVRGLFVGAVLLVAAAVATALLLRGHKRLAPLEPTSPAANQTAHIAPSPDGRPGREEQRTERVHPIRCPLPRQRPSGPFAEIVAVDVIVDAELSTLNYSLFGSSQKWRAAHRWHDFKNPKTPREFQLVSLRTSSVGSAGCLPLKCSPDDITICERRMHPSKSCLVRYRRGRGLKAAARSPG